MKEITPIEIIEQDLRGIQFLSYQTDHSRYDLKSLIETAGRHIGEYFPSYTYTVTDLMDYARLVTKSIKSAKKSQECFDEYKMEAVRNIKDFLFSAKYKSLDSDTPEK